MKIKRNAKVAIWLAVFYFTFSAFCQGAEAQSEIRFRLIDDSVIVVSLMANDQGPFDFVLDTGTNSTIVDLKLASRLALTALDRIQLITVAREATVNRSSLRSLSLGATTARDVEVLVQDLSEMRKVDSHIAGIVGQNFLRQFNYLIDYKHRSLRIELGDELKSAIGGSRTPVEINEGMMLVTSEAQAKNQAKLRLLLDSGANVLTLFHAASLGLDRNAPASAWTMNTGGDRSGTSTSRLKSLTVGTEQFRNVTVALPTDVAAGGERAEDGSLPAALFHAIYINNREGFVMFNPEMKGTPVQ
jgi:predicted aspartyl protease